jgi:hypothetical protein
MSIKIVTDTSKQRENMQVTSEIVWRLPVGLFIVIIINDIKIISRKKSINLRNLMVVDYAQDIKIIINLTDQFDAHTMLIQNDICGKNCYSLWLPRVFT